MVSRLIGITANFDVSVIDKSEAEARAAMLILLLETKLITAAEVHCRCGYSTPVAQHCVSRRDRIVPVLPKEEQWKIHYDYAGNLAYHLGITINGELWEKKVLPYLEVLSFNT